MKRILSVVLVAVLLAGMGMVGVNAITLDGIVGAVEWFDFPPIDLFPGPSQCSITSAVMRCEVLPATCTINFGFSATAPDVAADSPVGVVFHAGGQEIIRWQNGIGAVCDEAKYRVRGASSILPDSANGGYTFEIEVVCYSYSAWIALRDLSVQLIDSAGNPSRLVASPIVVPEPPFLLAAQNKINRLMNLIIYDWFSPNDFQLGKSVSYLHSQINQIYLQTEVINMVDGNLVIDRDALFTKVQAGTLDTVIGVARAEIMALLQRDLTTQAYQDVAAYLAVQDGMLALDDLYQLYRDDESAGLYHTFCVVIDRLDSPESAMNPLPAKISVVQWYAIQIKWNQMIEMYNAVWNSDTLNSRYKSDSLRGQCLLWVCIEIGDIIGLDLRPILGDFSLPELPAPPDPPTPPAPSHFWDTWPPFLQWILKYLLFGWLWMQWF